MVRIAVKTVKGRKYAYLEESVRIGDTIRNMSKYLGLADTLKDKDIKKAISDFKSHLILMKAAVRVSMVLGRVKKLEYPLNAEEVAKIEIMNLKHKEIVSKIHPKDMEDLNKRFIANYVFESNALEGNSLTLKNVAEIVFENRISSGKDLREVYDAQNSYNLFLYLQKARKDITHEFIIDIHARLMERIDNRKGYRNVPIILLGKPLAKLAKPEEVYQEMDTLIKWYNENKNSMYPLELAAKFHAAFEKIHPFSDGNGRVGRFMMNYILIRGGYFPIIIRKTTRNSYIKALEAADRGKIIVLMRFVLKHYKETVQKFYEVYYKYSGGL